MSALIEKLERRDRLSDAEKAVLNEVLTPPRKLKAGQDLVVEGDRPAESTLMVQGFSARYNSFPDGRRQITAIHIPGDFVDLHSFLLHPMDHGIVALTDCTVVTAPHHKLKIVTEEFPHLTRLLWLNTLIDASIHRRWLVAMGRQSSAQQLAHLLCELRFRLEVVGMTTAPGEFDMPATQGELADVLGISLVHVNRVVQELRREGLVVWKGRRLTILDWERLQAFSEFNPDYLHLKQEPR
jgi:CRP-like cAMP-binding protein